MIDPAQPHRSATPLRRSIPAAAAALSLLATLVMPAPAGAGWGRDEPVELTQATREIPEETLLDIGIEVFDPGLPEGDEHAKEDEGVFPAVRRAESRWLAVHLMRTLQSTGFWGAVRVVPSSAGVVDLAVSGEIVESNGAEMVVRIEAVDATGRTWLERKYKAEPDERAFREDGAILVDDPFQDLYDRVANDLLEERRERSADELREVRRVTALRFASELAPEAFGDYLERGRKDRYALARLPAEGDPMVDRVEAIRLRDHLFVDTVTGHYSTLYDRMEEPYSEWRRFSYEEEMARRKIQRKARTRKIVGALAILAGLLSDVDSRAEAAGRDVAIYGGAAAMQSGFQKAREAKIHVEALRELASSFDAEVEPMLIEVEGRTLRLEGSVEAQYAEWQEILQRMLRHETGVQPDPDTVTADGAAARSAEEEDPRSDPGSDPGSGPGWDPEPDPEG